jgi:hypothetical protein
MTTKEPVFTSTDVPFSAAVNFISAGLPQPVDMAMAIRMNMIRGVDLIDMANLLPAPMTSGDCEKFHEERSLMVIVVVNGIKKDRR